MIKIEIYERKVTYPTSQAVQKEENDVLVHRVESDDKVVLAAFLRGVADSYSPPKIHQNYRGVE